LNRWQKNRFKICQQGCQSLQGLLTFIIKMNEVAQI